MSELRPSEQESFEFRRCKSKPLVLGGLSIQQEEKGLRSTGEKAWISEGPTRGQILFDAG